MQTTPKLTDTQTLRRARHTLQQHLPLQASGYKCQSRHLYDALLGVAATAQTLETVCRDLAGAPKADTLRRYLNQQLTLEELPRLEKNLNEALSQGLPARLLGKAHQIAIDFHDQPYYGKAQQEQALWIRGRAKRGTTRFFRIATAYLIHRGMRLTLCLHFVRPGETTLEVLQRLLERLASLEIEIGCLLLDKGFSGIAVMEHLAKGGYAAIIACPIRGKKAPQPGGTRALLKGRKSYRRAYTFRDQENCFTAELAVCRVFTTVRRKPDGCSGGPIGCSSSSSEKRCATFRCARCAGSTAGASA